VARARELGGGLGADVQQRAHRIVEPLLQRQYGGRRRFLRRRQLGRRPSSSPSIPS
jgi:hypothetical protein